MLPSFSYPVLKLIVDRNVHEVVVNYEHVLARNTDYFSTYACVDNSTPGNCEFGRYVTFRGPQFFYGVIKEYSQWLDDGVIPTMESLDRLTPRVADQTPIFLARAYVFGEHIEDRRWMNYVMDALIRVHIHDWCFELEDVIYFAHDFAEHRSRLYKFLVDMQAYRLRPEDNARRILRDLPRQFLFDVLMRMHDKGFYTQSDWRRRLDRPRRYHVRG
jgi:hypothetical protein